MKKSNCKLIGTLAKPHGYKGDMVLFAEQELPEELDNLESVFVEIDGLLVPFFIEECRFTHDDSAIIRFEEIDNVDHTREFLHCRVYAPASFFRKKRPAAFGIDDLTGFQVTDNQYGNIGIVEEILDYNQNLVFRIVKGKQEILIPIHESIIENIDRRSKIITTNAPEGLIDIYLV